LRGEKRKEGGKESVTSDKLCQHLPRAPPKKQRHSSACNDMSEGGFWLLDGATRRAQRAQMPPTHANHFFLVFFLYYVNTKLPLNRLDNNKKKNHCENMKKPLEVLFNFFASRVFWSFQFIFLFFYI